MASIEAIQKAQTEMFVIIDGIKHPFADASFQLGERVFTGVEFAEMILQFGVTSGFWGAAIGGIGGYLLGRRKR